MWSANFMFQYNYLVFYFSSNVRSYTGLWFIFPSRSKVCY